MAKFKELKYELDQNVGWDEEQKHAMGIYYSEMDKKMQDAKRYERIADLTLKIMAGAASFGLGMMIAGVFV